MMRHVKIASASLNLIGQHWALNVAEIKKTIDLAIENNADILAFSALTLSTPAIGDYAKYADNEVTYQLLMEIAQYAAARNSNLIISIGHLWYRADKALKLEAGKSRQQDPRFNRMDKQCVAQSFIQGGRILGMSAQAHLDSSVEVQTSSDSKWHDFKMGNCKIKSELIEINY